MKVPRWGDTPLDILIEIFSYLPRRDQLAISLVCKKWRDALHCHNLWANMVIRLDADLMDPSTMMLTRMYYMHIRSLELGWANPQLPTRWLSYKHKEITKRATRYLSVLRDRYVQLETLKICDWYEICRFKKIIYHLSLFVKSQSQLMRLSFCNAYLNKVDFIKIFQNCRNSQFTLTHLDLRHCYYPRDQHELSLQIISGIVELVNLVVLKTDYSTLCREVMSALLISQNMKLQHLIVCIEDDDMTRAVKEETWADLKQKWPNLKVAFHFNNISNSYRLLYLLRKEIPLTTFSIQGGRSWGDLKESYRTILLKILANYKDTLEVMHFNVKDNSELLDDLLISVIRKCRRLQSFQFCGNIANFDLIRSICKFQNWMKTDKFKYFKLLPRNFNAEHRYNMDRLHDGRSRDMYNYNFDWKINNNALNNVMYFYY